MRKTKLLVFALAVIVVALAATGTAAYFTYSDTARNVITTGSFDISVIEQTIDENGELVNYPEEAIEVMPNLEISKVVTVKNNEADGFIRCRFVITVTDSDNNIVDYPEEHIYVSQPSEENWITKEDGDGWYYYKDVLSKDDITEPFIEKVIIAPELETCENCTVTVDIIAEGVQADNNGDDVLSAIGWPEAE